MVLQVLLQVNFVLEAVEAARTVVGPLVPVLPTVGDEVGALAEGFSAYVTHVRLLPSMYEGVLLHVRLLVKAFAAVLTGIGPGVGVYEQMSGEGGGALKYFTTHGAVKCPLLSSTY